MNFAQLADELLEDSIRCVATISLVLGLNFRLISTTHTMDDSHPRARRRRCSVSKLTVGSQSSVVGLPAPRPPARPAPTAASASAAANGLSLHLPQSAPSAAASFFAHEHDRLLSAATPRPPLPLLAPYLDDPTSPFQWLYYPHTVSGLLVALFSVLYFSFALPDPADELEARRRALQLVSVVFLVYCSIQLRDSLLVRPHPAVWRIVHGCGLLYLFCLSVLLAFPVRDGRALLRTFDASLGARPAENDKLYATDCRVYTPGDPNGPFARVKEVLLDIFVVAHTLGWLAKALLLRDWRLGWLLSVLWEIIELTFQNVLPNFAG